MRISGIPFQPKLDETRKEAVYSVLEQGIFVPTEVSALMFVLGVPGVPLCLYNSTVVFGVEARYMKLNINIKAIG